MKKPTPNLVPVVGNVYLARAQGGNMYPFRLQKENKHYIKVNQYRTGRFIGQWIRNGANGTSDEIAEIPLSFAKRNINTLKRQMAKQQNLLDLYQQVVDQNSGDQT
jgi:hypothetical protein